MKQKQINKLDQADDDAIELFIKLGMPKNLAKTLMYISQIDECCSSDIEKGTDMRQPEVSMAMQELLKRKWVKKRYLNKQGKGRPLHLYSPAVQLTEVWKAFETEKLQEVEGIKNDIDTLRDIIKVG